MKWCWSPALLFLFEEIMKPAISRKVKFNEMNLKLEFLLIKYFPKIDHPKSNYFQLWSGNSQIIHFFSAQEIIMSGALDA
jgi:hypothetical protein